MEGGDDVTAKTGHGTHSATCTMGKWLKGQGLGVTSHIVLPGCIWIGSIPPISLVAFIVMPWVYLYLYYKQYNEASGGVVVKALRYKPVGRGFDSRCCYWNFSVT